MIDDFVVGCELLERLREPLGNLDGRDFLETEMVFWEIIRFMNAFKTVWRGKAERMANESDRFLHPTGEADAVQALDPIDRGFKGGAIRLSPALR